MKRNWERDMRQMPEELCTKLFAKWECTTAARMERWNDVAVYDDTARGYETFQYKLNSRTIKQFIDDKTERCSVGIRCHSIFGDNKPSSVWDAPTANKTQPNDTAVAGKINCVESAYPTWWSDEAKQERHIPIKYHIDTVFSASQSNRFVSRGVKDGWKRQNDLVWFYSCVRLMWIPYSVRCYHFFPRFLILSSLFSFVF